MTTNLRDQLQATLSGTHTLERELGGGGMSKVFVAEEIRLQRKVVVKVLSPELAAGISGDRFERDECNPNHEYNALNHSSDHHTPQSSTSRHGAHGPRSRDHVHTRVRP